MAKSRIGKLEDYILVKKKESGIEDGGIYKLKPEFVESGEDPDTLYFIKQMKMDNTVSEYVGSNVARLLLGESAPEVRLLQDSSGIVYAASRAIENFKTASDHLEDAGLPGECWPHGCIIDDKGQMLPVQSYMLGWVQNNKAEVHKFKDSDKINLTARFLEHGDMHKKNLGVRGAGNKPIAAVIDFSRSLMDIIPSEEYELTTGNRVKIIATFEAIVEKAEVIALVDELLADADKVYGSSAPSGLTIRDIVVKKIEIIEREVVLLRFAQSIDTSHTALIKKYGNYINDKSFFDDVNTSAITHMMGSIIQSNNIPLLEKIMGYMQPNPNAMQKVLLQAVKDNKTAIFDKMLPYVQSSPSVMEKVFKSLVVDDKAAMFDKMLPYIQSDPSAMAQAFEEAVAYDRAAMFDKILPHIHSDPSAMKQAFGTAVTRNNEVMFDKILPHIHSDPSAMKQAFGTAIRYDKAAMFDKILPYMQSDLLTIKETFLNIVKNGKEAMFDKMLPYIQSNPSAMQKAFPEAVMRGSKTMLGKILQAMDEIENLNDRTIRKLVFLAEDDGELFIRLIEKGEKNNPHLIEQLKAILPEALKDPVFRQQMEDTAKAIGQEGLLDELIPNYRPPEPVIQTPVEAPTSGSILGKLDFLPNFPAAAATSLPLPQSGTSQEKPEPTDSRSLQSVTTSYPGSPGMALLAAGILAKSLYSSARGWYDYALAPKASEEEVIRVRATLKVQYVRMMEAIEEVQTLISPQRTEIRDRLDELSGKDALTKEELLEKATLREEFQAIKGISDSCVDAEATLEDIRLVFFKETARGGLKEKATPALSKGKLGEVEKTLDKLQGDIAGARQKAQEHGEPAKPKKAEKPSSYAEKVGSSKKDRHHKADTGEGLGLG